MARKKSPLFIELKHAMDQKNISTKDLCDGIGMAQSSFSRKCNGRTEFTLAEIKAIIQFIGLDSADKIHAIFFAV